MCAAAKTHPSAIAGKAKDAAASQLAAGAHLIGAKLGAGGDADGGAGGDSDNGGANKK